MRVVREDRAEARLAEPAAIATATEERLAPGSEFSWVVDHIQLHFFFAVFGDAYAAASRFVRANIIGVFPGSCLDVVPGEEFVIAGRNFVKAEFPVTAGNQRFVEGRSFPRGCRN